MVFEASFPAGFREEIPTKTFWEKY